MYLLIKSVVLFIGTAGFGLLDAEFVDEVCVLPVDIGVSCDNVNPQMHFYFNKYLEQCVPFMYKGCGGNGNRFLHSDDCTDACQVEWYKNKKSRKSESSIEEDRIVTPADCNEPAKPGPCRALNVQWFYDSKSGICRMFNYGGCMGNKNRFDTETQCQFACVSKNS